MSAMLPWSQRCHRLFIFCVCVFVWKHFNLPSYWTQEYKILNAFHIMNYAVFHSIFHAIESVPLFSSSSSSAAAAAVHCFASFRCAGTFIGFVHICNSSRLQNRSANQMNWSLPNILCVAVTLWILHFTPYAVSLVGIFNPIK